MTHHVNRLISVALLPILVMLCLTACEPTATKVSSSSAGPSSAPKGSASSQPATSGPVGTTFQVTDSGDNFIYKVTLTGLDTNAQESDGLSLTPAGDHLVAAKLTITGVSGSSSTDDANDDATAHGSNNQTYQSGLEQASDGTNFNSGDFTPAPGQTDDGVVVFEVPNDVTITSITWQDDGSFGATPVTWNA